MFFLRVIYRRNFTVAFAHLLHADPGLFELFMLMYFRPHNIHCVHIDAKVKREKKQMCLLINLFINQAGVPFRRAVLGLLRCYKDRFPASRIFLAEAPASVYWGHISLLERFRFIKSVVQSFEENDPLKFCTNNSPF